MAKFKCPKCGDTIDRDLRTPLNKKQLTKAGSYRSMCAEVDEMVSLKRV